MNGQQTPPRRALALALAALVLSPVAAGEGTPLREQIVGTWLYVAAHNVDPDGSRTPLFGPNPRGMASFDATGHYILMTSRAGLPRFAVDNRMDGTAEENRAVVQGSIAHYGTYRVNEADRTITFRIEASTFPNWNAAEQVRPFTLDGDELRWRTAASNGRAAEFVLRRAGGR